MEVTKKQLLIAGYKMGFSRSQGIVFGLALSDPKMTVKEANNRILSKLDSPIEDHVHSQFDEFIATIENT